MECHIISQDQTKKGDQLKRISKGNTREPRRPSPSKKASPCLGISALMGHNPPPSLIGSTWAKGGKIPSSTLPLHTSRVVLAICLGPLGYIKPPWACNQLTITWIHSSGGSLCFFQAHSGGQTKAESSNSHGPCKARTSRESWDTGSGRTLSVLCVEHHFRWPSHRTYRLRYHEAIAPIYKTLSCHFAKCIRLPYTPSLISVHATKDTPQSKVDSCTSTVQFHP